MSKELVCSFKSEQCLCPAQAIVGGTRVTSFDLAILTYLLEKLPVLCFLFEDKQHSLLL